jgi:low affinity Fe/Cu permease
VADGYEERMTTREVSTGGRSKKPHMPSDVTPQLSFFDRFATRAASFVSRAWFFTACVVLVVIWAPSIAIIQDINTWQLIINTITTIVTFLLVALLQNTQTRNDEATQDKLNALAEGMSALMSHVADIHDRDELRHAMIELRDAVGLEDNESA